MAGLSFFPMEVQKTAKQKSGGFAIARKMRATYFYCPISDKTKSRL